MFPSDQANSQTSENGQGGKYFAVSPPTISFPKGGGAIRGIGEKFAANPVTGTGSMSVPIATSPGRSGFGPQLSLSYDSGAGNGPFGFGWNLSLPSITRKTDKGLPKYLDAEESDVFILSGAEDLVPVLIEAGGNWQRHEDVRTIDGISYRIQRFRPRIEGLFARIERWTNQGDPEDIFWRSISRDNITTWYGKTKNSRIFDPADHTRIFSWLICQSYDDKGNAIVYEYVEENSERIFEDDQGNPVSLVHERNRNNDIRKANRYLKCIKYGNRTPNRDSNWNANNPTLLDKKDWMFEVVLDYGEGHYIQDPNKPPPDQHEYVQAKANLADTDKWPVRQDPFSSYRAGFEVRTYRLCRRVLMFHHFPSELGIDDYLVRSTSFTYRESPIASFITNVTQSGYVHKPEPGLQNRYLKKSLPPLEFEYSQPIIHDEVIEVDPESLENLPYGLDGTTYQWVDLDGEGLSGILTEQGGAWYYKPNLSPAPSPGKNGQDGTKARFGPLQRVAEKPSLAHLGSGGQQFLDLAGDGQLDLATFDGPTPGFFERTQDESWATFRTFPSLPNLNWNDPNLRFVDLTGDGHADILITEDSVFNWHLSWAEGGFGPREQVRQAFDEEQGPRLIFADRTQSIYLGDFSGDNLVDLGRVRNGEVCYWPNLGYGRFGAKVTMDNAPWLDAPDQFDQRRVRLADIDGSGTTDIIYLGRESIDIYRNQAGNSWSAPESLTKFPKVDNLSSVMAVDLLGNGTACLVWSSPLPDDATQPMRYIDLMGGGKPHLLIRSANNLGAEIQVRYAASTKFYLADKLTGKPWITRIPFPVHVVERVETYDHISRNRFVTRYAYHHGYFDGVEREFRGFGMVEQWDTEEFAALTEDGVLTVKHHTDEFAALTEDGEQSQAANIDAASHVPPVLTKTWFHTGAYLDGSRISRMFEEEYYHEGDPSLAEGELSNEQFEAMLLPDTVMPNSVLQPDGHRVSRELSGQEQAQASRAVKGYVLRQEIYALDSLSDDNPSEESDRPYTVSERNYTIEMLQPCGDNWHAVFFAHPRETINFYYERKLYDMDGEKRADPRVGHEFVLEVDTFGNVIRSASIGYGRRYPDESTLFTDADRQKQGQILATYIENRFTNAIGMDNPNTDIYLAPLSCEMRTYELRNIQPESQLPLVTNLVRFDEIGERILEAADGSHDLAYHDVDGEKIDDDKSWQRLIEHVRVYFRSNDLSRILDLGELDSMVLPGESYALAFTPALIDDVYETRVSDEMMIAGGYVHTESDASWWTPSGRVFYSPNRGDSPSQEKDFAEDHFFLPHRFRDPFDNETTVRYDSDPVRPERSHNLLVVETRDPLGNLVTVNTQDDQGRAAIRQDYRVLQPYWVTDPNGNRSAVAFDALGLVVGTAVMGKPEENLGDSLLDFKVDLTDSKIQDYLDFPLGNAAGSPAADPHDILQKATTRLVYDLFAYARTKGNEQPAPARVYTLARETHESDLNSSAGENTRIQHSFSYSDGFGREIQKKMQAEPERLPEGTRSTEPRWVGSGWTIFNNKGKPARQYEPFFDDTHQFKFRHKAGVSPILFYHPLGRLIVTLHPNHTYEKVVFDPWQQKTYDANDTAAPRDEQSGDPRTDPDIAGYVRAYFKTQPKDWQTWYQQRWAGALGPHQQAAAEKVAAHADTPTIAHFDTLGRPFLTVAHNRVICRDHKLDGDEDLLPTRVELDIEGNQRAVRDAVRKFRDSQGKPWEDPEGRIVMTYDYSIAGPGQDENGEPTNTHRIHQASMEAGQRWTLNDVSGQPIYTWDSRGHVIEKRYDELRRPVITLVQGIDGFPAHYPVLVDETVYGETQGSARNHRGQVYQQYDAAGIVTNIGYDFKGNLLESSRQLTDEYIGQVNWANLPTLGETYAGATRYDALNRPVQIIAPHSRQAGVRINILQPAYNEANLLEQMHVWLNRSAEPARILSPATADLWAVANIDYNAKGQRTRIEYGTQDGAGITTTYDYESDTFRLILLKTRRNSSDFNSTDRPGEVQHLQYTYDPAGNTTHVQDDAKQTIFFNNQRVEQSNDYTYDAIYRLIKATGREHLGQAGAPIRPSYNDAVRTGISNPGPGSRFHPGDGDAMGRYCEMYVYDAVSNFLEMSHHRSCANVSSWTRRYVYDEESPLEAGKQSNRLSSTQVGNGITAAPESYAYDAHGSMISMPHLQVMQWDYKDQLQQTRRQAIDDQDKEGALKEGERTYYVYDAGGQRVRKVTVNKAGDLKEEHMYLGGFEIYRKHSDDHTGLVRETLHIMDERQRIAIVETRTKGADPGPAQLIRYQLGNHLDSASLELDDQAQIITYEEYTPYGSTSYQAVRSRTETSKRFRYTDKERDEESGFYYYGARYYAPWLGRWMSCDPGGLVDGVNLYQFLRGSPINMVDLAGYKGQPRIEVDYFGSFGDNEDDEQHYYVVKVDDEEFLFLGPEPRKEDLESEASQELKNTENNEGVESNLEKIEKGDDKRLELLKVLAALSREDLEYYWIPKLPKEERKEAKAEQKKRTNYVPFARFGGVTLFKKEGTSNCCYLTTEAIFLVHGGEIDQGKLVTKGSVSGESLQKKKFTKIGLIAKGKLREALVDTGLAKRVGEKEEREFMDIIKMINKKGEGVHQMFYLAPATEKRRGVHLAWTIEAKPPIGNAAPRLHRRFIRQKWPAFRLKNDNAKK